MYVPWPVGHHVGFHCVRASCRLYLENNVNSFGIEFSKCIIINQYIIALKVLSVRSLAILSIVAHVFFCC